MGPKSVIVVLLLAVASFAALSLPFFAWIPDDAYISFQYARSFVEGDGLVFNPDERVEGFSNPLWTMLLALVARTGREIEAVAPLLSCAAAVLSIVVFLLLLLRAYPVSASTDRRSSTLIVGSLTFAYASSFPLAFYATSGLETAPYVLCLLVGAALHLRAVSRGSGWAHYASLAAFLAGALMRPEGIGFLLVSVAFLLFRVRTLSGRLIAALFLSVFAYLTALSIRFEYYGGFVPNTYFAKPPATLHYLSPITTGLQYLSRFLTQSGVVLMLVLALVIPQDQRKRYAWVYLWALAAYQIFFMVYVGADVLRFDRFTVPLAPWIYALAAMGLLGFVDGSEERGRRFTRRTAVVGVAILAALNAGQAARAHGRLCFHDWMHAHVHRAVGRMLGELVPPGAEIVANEVGAIRYHSRRPVVDMLGLTDKTVAEIRYRSFQEYGVGSSPWSVQAVTAYLLDRNPECIVLPSEGILSLDDKEKYRGTMHPLWYALLTAPGLDDRYRPVLYVEIHESKYLYIFLRSDIKFPPAHFAVPLGECMRVRRLDA
jgi:arabinofuranosyltransferase